MILLSSIAPVYIEPPGRGDSLSPPPRLGFLDVPGAVVVLRGILQPRGSDLQQVPRQRIQNSAVTKIHLPRQNTDKAVGIVLVSLSGRDEVDARAADAAGMGDSRGIAVAKSHTADDLVVRRINGASNANTNVLTLHDVAPENATNRGFFKLILATLEALQSDVLERAIRAQVARNLAGNQHREVAAAKRRLRATAAQP